MHLILLKFGTSHHPQQFVVRSYVMVFIWQNKLKWYISGKNLHWAQSSAVKCNNFDANHSGIICCSVRLIKIISLVSHLSELIITMASQIKETWLFIQQPALVQANDKETSKLYIISPLFGETTGHQWIPSQYVSNEENVPMPSAIEGKDCSRLNQ